MIRIEGDKIILCSVDISDIDTILLWENSSSEPLYGVFEEQYTREDVERFVERQQHYSIAETEQLRLMICTPSGERLGAIDLCDFDGCSATLSIIIVNETHRGMGYGGEALRLAVDYARLLGISTLRAEVMSENKISRQMFISAGFENIEGNNFELQLSR